MNDIKYVINDYMTIAKLVMERTENEMDRMYLQGMIDAFATMLERVERMY